MSFKLNPLCKRLFLEFSAEKYHDEAGLWHEDRSSFDFARYPLLSRSFLYASKYPRPFFCLGISADDLGPVEVSFVDPVHDDYTWPCSKRTTPDSLKKMLALFDPLIVHVRLRSSHFFAPIQDVFDDYEGKLWLNVDFNTGYRESTIYDAKSEVIQVINKWNSKLSSVIDAEEKPDFGPAKVLLSCEGVLPLELDYCHLEDPIDGNQLFHLLDQHKIKRLKFTLIFVFDDLFTDYYDDYEDEKEDEEYEDEEEEEPPRNVGSLKYVESNIEFEKLRRVARLFVGNKFSLTELSFETRITNHYSNFDSLLNHIMEIYHKILDFKERYKNMAEKFQIKTKCNFSSSVSAVEFKQEWIGNLRRQCDILKDAEYEVDNHGYHALKTQVVDGCLTLDMDVKIR